MKIKKNTLNKLLILSGPNINSILTLYRVNGNTGVIPCEDGVITYPFRRGCVGIYQIMTYHYITGLTIYFTEYIASIIAKVLFHFSTKR